MKDNFCYVYLSGAHSVGKTTLLNYLSEKEEFRRLNFIRQEEIARYVIENEYPQERRGISDPEGMKILENKLIKRQYYVEENNIKVYQSNKLKVKGFLWDRGFMDAVAYMKHFAGVEEANNCVLVPEAQAMLSRWQNTNKTLVFLLYPEADFLVNDGVRMQTESVNLLIKIHSILEELLMFYGIKYYVIKMKNLDERANFVLDKMQQNWKELFS